MTTSNGTVGWGESFGAARPMENGEVAGRGSNSWGSWKATKPDWIRGKKINILVQIGLRKAPDLPDVPLLTDLVDNPEDAALPGVPPDRVKILRDAFDATIKDPAFIDEARRLNLSVNASSGAELQRIVADIVNARPAVAQHLSRLLDPSAR